jgi:hypothetical protein
MKRHDKRQTTFALERSKLKIHACWMMLAIVGVLSLKLATNFVVESFKEKSKG